MVRARRLEIKNDGGRVTTLPIMCSDPEFGPQRNRCKLDMLLRVAPIHFSKNAYRFAALCCGLAFGSVVFSTEVDASETHEHAEFSLQEAYELARDSYPQLAIARLRVDGAEADKDEAQGRFFPQVSLFGEWSQNKVRYESNELLQLPSQDYPGERYGMQLRSPLFNMRAFREYERQGELVNQTQEELRVAEAELLRVLVEVFLSALLAVEDLAQLESEADALESQLQEAQALYEKSLLPVTQVLETQTRVDTLRADIIESRGKVALSRERLFQLTGIQAVAPLEVVDQILLSSSVASAESAAAIAVQFDAAVAAAQEAVSAARKGIQREKGSWWPEIDFVYNSQFSDVGFDNLTSPPRSSESYSVSFRYPLFEGGAGSARLRGAWAEFYSAQQQLEATKRESMGRARAAWVNLETATERVQATRQAVKTAEVNVDASRKAVRAGSAKPTDVLLALAQSTRANRDLNEARFQRAMSWLELELATGADPVALTPGFSTALHGR